MTKVFYVNADLNKVVSGKEIAANTQKFTQVHQDAVIAENTFTVTVTEAQNTPPEEETPENEIEGTTEGKNTTNTTEENLPTQLPKTGINLYIPIVVIVIAIMSTSLYISMKKKNR